MIEEPTKGELYYKGIIFLENDSETKALNVKIQIVSKSLRVIKSTQIGSIWKNH